MTAVRPTVLLWCLAVAVAGCDEDQPGPTPQAAPTGVKTAAPEPLPPVARCENDLDKPSCEKLCAAKVAIGCQRLGYLYLEGVGVPKDRDRAIKYFDMACKLGHEPSCG